MACCHRAVAVERARGKEGEGDGDEWIDEIEA